MTLGGGSGIDDLEAGFRESITIDQLRQLVVDIEVEQQNIETNIKSFSTNKSLLHQSTVRSLEISRVELASTLNHSRNLKTIMEKANDLGYHITDKVRILDDEKLQITKLKEYVDNVNTLKLEIKRANDSMGHNELLNAAKSISVIRSLPPELIMDAYADFKVPTAELDDPPYKMVNKWIEELEILFIKGFNTAADNKDVKLLTFYFQLFPLIGKASKGLACYSHFICNIINESSRNILKGVRNNDSQPEIYAQILFKLYKTISSIVIQHSKVIKSYYGEEVLTGILKDIQVECDLQSNLIYDTYVDSKDIESIKMKIQKYDYPILIREITQSQLQEQESDSEAGEIDNGTTVSLVDVNKVTDELSAMMSHWSMYTKFFAVFWNENSKDQIQVYPPPLILSTFADKISKTVVQNFDLFCTYSVRRTLEKACVIESLGDALPYLTNGVEILQTVFKKLDSSNEITLHSLIPEDAPISSLADDLILVLNTIIMEVLSTGQLVSIKNMVSNIKRILVVDFTGIVQQKMNKLILKSTSNLLTKSVIQKIHKAIDPESYTPNRSQSPAPNTPASRVVGGTAELANTGALFMKSLNAAISYTITGEDDTELIVSGHASDVQTYLIYLNTLSTFSSYLSKLIDKCCDTLLTNSLLIIDENDINNVQHALESNSETEINLKIELFDTNNKINHKVMGLLKTITVGFKERSDAIIIGRVSTLFERVLKMKVIKLVRDSINSSYLHSNEEYNNQENKLNSFIKNWNSLIIPYASVLSKDVFQLLLSHVINSAVLSLEDKIWGLEKKISSLGAISLEHDISFVIGELTKFDYSLRDKFLKVTQLVMLLGLEDDDEVLELEVGGIEWALTPSERNKCRGLLLS